MPLRSSPRNDKSVCDFSITQTVGDQKRYLELTPSKPCEVSAHQPLCTATTAVRDQ